MARTSASTTLRASSPPLSRSSPRWVRGPSGSRWEPPSSTCATRTRSTWPRTPARPISSPAAGCSSGISRGSPEQVIDGYRHFGYEPAEGETDADMARRHAEVFLELLKGEGFAQPNPRPMFPNPPGLLRLEPYSPGLRERIWWGAASTDTAVWTAQQGMNLMSSTLVFAESDDPLHVQQRRQIDAYRAAWKEAGHAREPRVSVSRSIFALVDDRDREYFGGPQQGRDQFGYIEPDKLAVFGRSYAAEPDELVEQLKEDTAIEAADTLLLTVPNQLGVDYNAHAIESILQVRRAGARLALSGAWRDVRPSAKAPRAASRRTYLDDRPGRDRRP